LTTEQAKAIVSRHVVAGATVYAADVATGDVETFGGEKIGLVKTTEGGVQVAYNGQTVNVVTADVEGSNGIIHVIDNVIVGGAPKPDVVDVAVGAGSFTTLVKIVKDLGLVDTLKGVDAVTIFAPSDEAFAKLPAGTLESLTTEQAKAIVSRHVVAGATVYAADVATGDVETFGGEKVGLVKTAEGGVQVAYNGQTVNVVTADVEGSNGVIHVIDNVILGGAPKPDVVDVAVGAGSFTTLVKIVSDLGLVDTLKGVDAVTIFAPSDEAFAKLPAGTLESLTTEQAKAIVSRHVVAGATVYAADVATGDVETFGGEKIGLVKTTEGGVQVAYNGQTVNVVTADVEGSNGIIHVIDNVIVGGAPKPDVVDVAVGAGSFTTLVKIVKDLGLVDTLKGVDAVTIFAPSDEAFAKLPAGTLESLTTEQAKAIVSRHVVAGATVYAADVATGDVETFGGEKVGLVKTAEGGVQVAYNGQTVNVVTADVEGSNGVIHVIDNVILGGDVVDVAVGAGAFTTLVKIVSDLGLVETLKGVDSVTIFAPSDEAFAKLPEGTLESLTTEQAKAIVSRHVVPGATVYAADVATGTVGTFGGENIELIKNDDGVQVSYNGGNAVNVVSADVKANNGVIHVIDAVIL